MDEALRELGVQTRSAEDVEAAVWGEMRAQSGPAAEGYQTAASTPAVQLLLRRLQRTRGESQPGGDEDEVDLLDMKISMLQGVLKRRLAERADARGTKAAHATPRRRSASKPRERAQRPVSTPSVQGAERTVRQAIVSGGTAAAAPSPAASRRSAGALVHGAAHMSSRLRKEGGPAALKRARGRDRGSATASGTPAPKRQRATVMRVDQPQGARGGDVSRAPRQRARRPGQGAEGGLGGTEEAAEALEEAAAAVTAQGAADATEVVVLPMRDLSGEGAVQSRRGGGVADDWDPAVYRQRLAAYHAVLERDLNEAAEGDRAAMGDVTLDGGLRIPGRVHASLFPYQRFAVRWLWDLYKQGVGGIVGDEMGLGKTVQISAFLAALKYSDRLQPSLIVCPSTMIAHWARELRRWYAPTRVFVLHESGAAWSSAGWARERIVDEVLRHGDVVVTSYGSLRLNQDLLLPHSWGLAILDEGDRIRNPDAETTLVAKQLDTPHRLILTGAPMQNNLKELWSLFDFVVPGRLGTLPVFEDHFIHPISRGGYSNATAVQARTASRCALELRDVIQPYLLRRLKRDIKARLPNKTEHVLFCRLTPQQRSRYLDLLASDEVDRIIRGDQAALRMITLLRKVCNHPDLLDPERMEQEDFGLPELSTKLMVLDKVLPLWEAQGHHALVFTQTRQMLDILELHARQRGFRFMRMDGMTSIRRRQEMVDRFNTGAAFLFLLTTRVGGVGVNLVGADRVVLFDPDWNPSTDTQARERAWRLGQQREVTIYRLITTGTVEEKIYHRQIFKQLLTDKILKDPHQKRPFQSRDLRDLFTLSDESRAEGATETERIFGRSDVPVGSDPGPAVSRQSSAASASDTGAAQNGAGSQGSAAASASAQAGGREFEPLVREEVLEPGPDAGTDGQGGAAPAAEAEEGEGHILRALFDGGAVNSVFAHDVVEGNGDGANQRQRSIETEAKRVAKSASHALARSRREIELTRGGRMAMPTWTGQRGARPLFGQSRAANAIVKQAVGSLDQGAQSGVGKSAFGGARGAGVGGGGQVTGSASLLSQIQARERGEDAASESRDVFSSLLREEAAQRGSQVCADNEEGADPVQSRANALIRDLHAFLVERGGRVNSQQVIQHFGNRIGATEGHLLRKMLHEIAQHRRGCWELRAGFL